MAQYPLLLQGKILRLGANTSDEDDRPYLISPDKLFAGKQEWRDDPTSTEAASAS